MAALCFAGVATAGPVDDYVDLRATELLDIQCGTLKYVEHEYLLDAQVTALEATAEWTWLKSGRFTQEQYNAWLDERDAAAQLKAHETGGCTQAASHYLLNGRDRASATIAQGLMLALHFDSLSEADRDRHILEPDQKQAVMAYDAFLQQIYADNYQGFMAFQRQQAAAGLPVSSSNPYDILSNPLDALYGRTDADIEKVDLAQRRATRAVNAVQFEVLAETNGWRILPMSLPGGWRVPTLRRPDAAGPENRLIVVAGPDTYALADYSGSFRQLLARAPDGTLRLMIFGQAADRLGPSPVARLYVPSMPLPVGASDWSYFNDPGFRDLAMSWDGMPLPGSSCLGSLCYEFPPEVFDAIARRGEQGSVELYLAEASASTPPPISPGSYRSGRIASRHFFTLMQE